MDEIHATQFDRPLGVVMKAAGALGLLSERGKAKVTYTQEEAEAIIAHIAAREAEQLQKASERAEEHERKAREREAARIARLEAKVLKIPWTCYVPADLPGRVAAILLSMLRADPGQRVTNGEVLSRAIAALERELDLKTPAS